MQAICLSKAGGDTKQISSRMWVQKGRVVGVMNLNVLRFGGVQRVCGGRAKGKVCRLAVSEGMDWRPENESRDRLRLDGSLGSEADGVHCKMYMSNEISRGEGWDAIGKRALVACALSLSLLLGTDCTPAAAAVETGSDQAALVDITSSSSTLVNNSDKDYVSQTIDSKTPIVDYARVLPKGIIESKQTLLRDLERDTGYKVRLLSRYGTGERGPTGEEVRRGWGVDEKTILMVVDPTSPNIMAFSFGLEVQKVLPRPFFTELQSRFGNLFYIRENGEAKAVVETLDTLDTCLRRDGGCRVPPGLPSNQYVFTLITSIAGGLICGASLRLEPQGFVQRRWVWALLFSPLWGSLAINFGIGPIVSRTDDPLPVVANIAAALASAALVFWYPQAAEAAGLSVMSVDETDGDRY